EH
ncbi:hypothetical protein VCHENC02_1492B, partial [Vibrio harveyi]